MKNIIVRLIITSDVEVFLLIKKKKFIFIFFNILGI